jgi:hypothetical protein
MGLRSYLKKAEEYLEMINSKSIAYVLTPIPLPLAEKIVGYVRTKVFKREKL